MVPMYPVLSPCPQFFPGLLPPQQRLPRPDWNDDKGLPFSSTDLLELKMDGTAQSLKTKGCWANGSNYG